MWGNEARVKQQGDQPGSGNGVLQECQGPGLRWGETSKYVLERNFTGAADGLDRGWEEGGEKEGTRRDTQVSGLSTW